PPQAGDDHRHRPSRASARRKNPRGAHARARARAALRTEKALTRRREGHAARARRRSARIDAEERDLRQDLADGLALPFAFPSQPGLIAPLCRRRPHRFDALGCAIGAMVPDIVDGVIGFARGDLGQWWGHSLLGVLFLDVPVGWLLTLLAARLPKLRDILTWRRPAFGGSVDPRAPPSRLISSIWIGALSHVFFDFISHETFLLLLPWHANARVFPSFWYARWFELRTPFYK